MRPDAIDRAAATLGCEPAALRAVITVETGGAGGFLNDGSGRPRILFEAHHFGRLTGFRFNTSNPGISSRSWNRSLYRGGAAEYDRLAEAVALDRAAAIGAASWGMFQVMGFWAPRLGYSGPDEWVEEMAEGEDAQLSSFVAFIRTFGLEAVLRVKDWAGFAARYNGPSYAVNRYDARLADAYDLARGARPAEPRIGTSGAMVRQVQEALNRAGAGLTADGIFGRVTELALQQYQATQGLPVTGRADAATLARLSIAA